MEKELYDLFKKAHPETVGETDKEYDRYNYMEWLEKQVISLKNNSCNECGKVLEQGAVFCSVDCRIHYHN